MSRVEMFFAGCVAMGCFAVFALHPDPWTGITFLGSMIVFYMFYSFKVTADFEVMKITTEKNTSFSKLVQEIELLTKEVDTIKKSMDIRKLL